jgi:DNA-binding NtrC family response regulator
MKKILFIDEDFSVLHAFYEDLIETYNFDVNWITKADDVMDAFEGEKYDAIILDIMMPVPKLWSKNENRKANFGLATGIILFQKIREKYPQIPILIYSAKGGIPTDEHSSYLRKPELTQTIVDKLKKLMKDEK